jgi:hypothetical protein
MRCFGPLSLTFPLPPLFQTPSYGPDDDDDDYYYRYQRDNKNPYSEEEQKTQWQTEKVQKDKQRSTKHTHCRNHWIAPFVFSNVY